ncbi:MAG: hypothetical protein QME57_03870 [Patescibacteria group bacterium]|nr:hypothetical protein [Patescibacteria group bacterium]
MVAGVYTEYCSLDENTNLGLSVNGNLIYELVDKVKFSDIDGRWDYLGEIGPEDSLIVTHQYQLDSGVINWTQGDVMEFTITLYAEQLRGLGP